MRVPMDVSRKAALENLLALHPPLHESIAALRGFEWDSDVELVSLSPLHIRAALAGFVDGDLGADDIEAWANAIECRDDIEYSPEEPVGLALDVLANPVLYGVLTTSLATELMALLSAPSSGVRRETK